MINKAIILPYKESFSKRNSGAASIFVKETLTQENLNEYAIYGSKTSVEKNYKNCFYSSNAKSKIFKNYFYINGFVKKFFKTRFDFIEIHNRPEYVKIIRKAFPSVRIIFFFHNLPTTLRGSKSVDERIFLFNNCEVFFISKYIQKNFFDKTNLKIKNNSIVYPGFETANIKTLKKKNIILFCGKLNPAKGYDIFCEATKEFLKNKKFRNWKIISIGTELRRSIPKYSHVNELGQIPNKQVLQIYKQAKIAVAPSVWREPLGRLPTESASQGCVPVTSASGGLPETNLNGFIIKKINIRSLSEILVRLCSNLSLLDKLCAKQISNFKFSKKKLLNNIFNIRHKKKNIKNILLIANLNLRQNKFLYYSFFNKIKSALYKTFYNIRTISDRDVIRKSRSFTDIFGTSNFNKLILNSVKKFLPELIILGHTDRINLNTFKEIKKISPNIKIVKVFIDSLSPEFFNFDKTFYDYGYLDKIFVSSDPSILAKKDIHNKTYFIPYPVDKKIDCVKSFNKKNYEIDVFFALSHGQNRMVLKQGKRDEREIFILKLKKNLEKFNIKTRFIGIENAQPIWGKDFYNTLHNTKIGINLSRGKYKKLYSSDRIALLFGSGVCVLNERINKYNIFFNKSEMVNFTSINELVKNIVYLCKNENVRLKIAKKGYNKYYKLFNSKNIIKYIINKTLYPNKKIFKFDQILSKKI